MLVCIEGGISAGKSTLVKWLNGIKFYEPLEAENPFLNLFYEDPKRHATNMQLFTLMYRYRQWKEAQARSLNFPDKVYLLDRSLFMDCAFEKINHEMGNISDDEHQLYVMAHETLQEQIYFPDLILWIRAKPETCMERLKKRARGCECGVELSYLQRLEDAYCACMETLKHKCKVVELDGEQDEDAVLEEAKQAIEERKKEINAVWPRWKGGL